MLSVVPRLKQTRRILDFRPVKALAVLRQRVGQRLAGGTIPGPRLDQTRGGPQSPGQRLLLLRQLERQPEGVGGVAPAVTVERNLPLEPVQLGQVPPRTGALAEPERLVDGLFGLVEAAELYQGAGARRQEGDEIVAEAAPLQLRL